MKNLVIILIFSSFNLIGCDQGGKSFPNQDRFIIFGNWKVSSFKSGSISGITEEEAKEYLGRSVVLEKDSAVFLHDMCINKPQYRIRTANSEEYLYFNFKFPPIELGIDEKEIDILEIYCSDEQINLNEDDPFYELIIYKDKYLIDSWDGYFFFLEQNP